MTDTWQNCYNIGWGKNLVPEAFSHPAKVSFSLAGKIYNHAINMGWVKRGGSCLDPFGGICGFGYHAMCYGLHFIGVELEQKFVSLGQQNIELWNRQLKGWPNLGTARIVQGDSRRLRDVVTEANLIVSSPPYADWHGDDKRFGILRHKDGCDCNFCKKNKGNRGFNQGYQDIRADLVVSSPPFSKQAPTIKMDDEHIRQLVERTNKRYGRTKITFEGVKKNIEDSQTKIGDTGHTPGNLANMKEGDINLVIGSPPFMDNNVNIGAVGDTPAMGQQIHNSKKRSDSYGQSPGQLGSMKEGSFDLITSSPPYEASISSKRDGIDFSKSGRTDKMLSEGYKKHYPIGAGAQCDYAYNKANSNNLGNTSGDTFWSASREIVQGCHELLKPGGHAIWICKDYIKKGRRIPFSDRWLALCESIGFKLVCRHKAMLVRTHGVQTTIHGDETIETSRKSFFRRLAESKGSPRIDWEDIICLVKDA